MRAALLAGAALLGWAAARPPRLRGARVLRINRVVADLARAEAFYRDAVGFRRVDAPASNPAAAAILGLPGMQQVVMRLGAQEIALVQTNPPGQPYPEGSHSNDLWFQHLAIVVDDMDAAYRLVAAAQPDPITLGGPQILPPRNGRVAAFKFRDPDGHPLELLHFPPGQLPAEWHGATPGPFLGIDHSAISISSARRSLNFYRALGFTVQTRSLNEGAPQSRLDDIPDARVHITGLRLPRTPSPGLELLRYDPPGRPRPPVPPTALLTDWITLYAPSITKSRLLTDPDGHRILLQGT